MNSKSQSNPKLIAHHEWLLKSADDIGYVSFHFPCRNLWGGDDEMVFETRDLLTMVADDCDESGGDGTLYRQIRDRHFPEDLDWQDAVELDGLDDFLTEIEATQPSSAHLVATEHSENSDPAPYVPDICSRPARQTKIAIPATEDTVATAFEFETRYLLSLIVKKAKGSPRHSWWETLTEIFYPEIEPPEFQQLPTEEAFRKEHYTSFLRYLAKQAEMSRPTHPDAKGEIAREFEATRNLLLSIGFFDNIEPFRPGEDDITETCEKLCSLIDRLPPGVLNNAQ